MALWALVALVGPLAVSPSALASTPSAWGLRQTGSASALQAARASRAALATPGSAAIAGMVTAAEGGASIEGIEVCAYELGEGLGFGCASTNASGKYEVSGLVAGSYEVEFLTPEASTLNFLTQFYDGKEDEVEADPVALSEGTKTTGIDAAMRPGAQIEGAVKDGEEKLLESIEVCALEAATGFAERCAETNAAGEYDIAGLTSGSYEVEFSVPFKSGLNYATQFYDGVSARSLAGSVTVTAGGAAAEHIDATMAPGGSIGGTITAASTKEGLAEVFVCVRDPTSDVERCDVSHAGGGYTVAGLPSGSYQVQFVPASPGYGIQYYKDRPEQSEAELVPVSAPETSAEIDAALPHVPVSQSRPRISGAAVEGQALTVTPGTWSDEPTSVTDEWGQCGSSGEIETCHTVATSPAYTPTAADVGHTIRIREKARNAAGEAESFSLPTAVVAAPPGGPSPAPTTPAPAVAQSSSGVSSEIAHLATAAQLKALLARLLVPRGKSAKLAALHARGGYTTTFSSLAAGRISISWYFLPKGAHLSAAKPKPLLVAAGKLTTKASGTAKLTIKLTAAGRALLAKGKPLKLMAKGAFAPKGHPTLKATRSFTLQR